MFSREKDPGMPETRVPEPYEGPAPSPPEHLVSLQGVRIPTLDDWVDVPGSPFQVKTQGRDEVGVFWVRLHPEITWDDWEGFKARVDERYREFMKRHPLGKFLGYE